jgi:hypothetical protein
LLKQVNLIAFSKKVTLKQLQSLCGILAFWLIFYNCQCWILQRKRNHLNNDPNN